MTEKVKVILPNWNEMQQDIKAVSLRTHLIQKYFDKNLESVKLELKQFQDALQEMYVKQYTAPAKEGDDMSESMVEKLHSIDNRLGISENEIKNISSGVARVEGDIKTLNGKIDKVLEKFDSTVTKTELKEKIDSAKWTISFIMTLIAIAAGIVIKLLS